jgi:hypothetical protein
MTLAETAGTFSRFVEAVKDLPAWLFTAFAIASGVLLFVPAVNVELPQTSRPWLVVSAVVFAVLAVFKWINVFIDLWRSSRATAKARKTYHLTPISHHCFWGVAKQPDGSSVTQLVADFAVKNQSVNPIGLMSVRVIAPSIRGEVLHNLITVREQHGTRHGSAIASDHRIAAGTVLPARVSVMIRGKPRRAEEQELKVTFGITDDDGNEQRVRVICKGQVKTPAGAPLATSRESLESIADTIEKDVAAVLQSELNRYEKNGRQAGGLGSIHLTYHGRAMNQIGTDAWTPNSPTNQEIANDPEQAVLCSDNLDALLAVHARLSGVEEHNRFINALLSRLNEKQGYAKVSYFITCALWKLGFLNEALDAALFGLSENNNNEFGISNMLMMFNGLLRYRHPDFTGEMLDVIERFLQGSEEHQFRITHKIAAIRTYRLTADPQSQAAVRGAN